MFNPDKPRRAILLIEMESGVQHGYDVTHLDTFDISWDPPSSAWEPFSWTQTGSITAHGILTALVRMPDMNDMHPDNRNEPDELAHRPALEEGTQ